MQRVGTVGGSDVVGVVTNWDLSMAKQRVGFKNPHLSSSDIDDLEREYRRYLVMLALYPGKEFPMPELIDEFGHAHMLFTEDFRGMCNSIEPGSVIDHHPTLSEEENTALLPLYHQNTLRTFRQLFNEEPNSRFWPTTRCVCKWDRKPAS